MTSVVSTVGTVTGAAATQAAAVVQPVALTAPVTSTVQAASSAPLTPQVPQPTQRVFFDPQAGLINQYLNSKGGIQTQIPSSVVVAYLRAGLTADGLTKQQAQAAQGGAVA